MPATVLVKDIVEALEMIFDEHPSFLDLDTGKVETVSRELLREAEEYDEEEEPDILGWQKDEWEVVKRIVTTDRFLELPTKDDVNDWEIMEDFSLSVESAKIREELLNAIGGRGAFRYFKDTIRQRGIEKDWYAFRENALRDIAIEWCEENDVAWK
jgi:hypothetical protein